MKLMPICRKFSNAEEKWSNEDDNAVDVEDGI
jgi:hypothetical protein